MLTNSTAEPLDEDAAVALMIKVRAEGCRESFDQLVREWGDRVKQLCFRMCGNLVDAEDLTQEVFQKLYVSRARYEPTAKFSTFLWSIAANHCRDFLRSRRRHRHVQSDANMDDLSSVRESVGELDRDSRSHIREAIWRLPRHYREVVVLRHYENMKFADIGRLLGIPRGTVASRMAKALRLLEVELVRRDLLPRQAPFGPED